MEDMAVFLHDIFELEHIEHPVLIGQSMGGYVSQMYMELYPGSHAVLYPLIPARSKEICDGI